MADRDSIAAAATVAVVLALGIGFVVTHGDDSDPKAPPSTTSSGVPTCSDGDLVLGPVDQELAAGTSYVTATLRLGDDVAPCTVEGYPRVILLADGRPAGVETVPDQTLGRPRRLTVLPDRSARVTLAWAVFHYCAPVVNDRVLLWAAPGLTVDLPGFGPASCRGDEGRPPVRIGAFSYVDPRDEKGSVTGLVTLNDGPGPGTGEYATSGQVEFVGADTYRAPIGPAGAYDIELPVGLYTVRVSTHQWHAGETYLAGQLSVTSGDLGIYNIPMPLR
jgi:hypothetical protein